MSEDLRFTTNSKIKDFHRNRRAFIIYDEKLYVFSPDCTMSHWEYCQNYLPEIDKEKFKLITRGYFLNGDLVFYKDNFIFDENMIKEALKFIDIVKRELRISEAKVYFGCKVGKPYEVWEPDFLYGELRKNGQIERAKDLNLK